VFGRVSLPLITGRSLILSQLCASKIFIFDYSDRLLDPAKQGYSIKQHPAAPLDDFTKPPRLGGTRARPVKCLPPLDGSHALPEHPLHITLGEDASTSKTPNERCNRFMTLLSRPRGEEIYFR
jgi:hypothetical protein